MPRQPAPSSAQSGGSGGFALILVLWTLVLIAFITAQLLGTARVETAIARNLVAEAAIGAAADGAVNQAIFGLLDPRPETGWALDGSVHELEIGGFRVDVQVQDEAGRINPNLAPPALLEGLLRVTGADAEIARQVSRAVGEWVGVAMTPERVAAALEDYRAAGLDHGPPAEPMETLDELQRVQGVTASVYAAIRPHLSLFAPAAEPALAHADPVVRAAVALAGGGRPTGQAAPKPFARGVVTARISVIAKGPSASATRTAIVRIEPPAQKYTVLAWYGEID